MAAATPLVTLSLAGVLELDGRNKTKIHIHSKSNNSINDHGHDADADARNPTSCLLISKPKPPSWIVTTQSNVRKHVRKKPDPPCIVCKGTGRVNCHHCFGKGRINHAHKQMLPKGEWPKWCCTCGGSGLGHCSRCLGTGEYRYIMGFHFMKADSEEDAQDDPASLSP